MPNRPDVWGDARPELETSAACSSDSMLKRQLPKGQRKTSSLRLWETFRDAGSTLVTRTPAPVLVPVVYRSVNSYWYRHRYRCWYTVPVSIQYRLAGTHYAVRGLPPAIPARLRRLTGTGAGTACIFIGYLQYTHTIAIPELAKVGHRASGHDSKLGPGTGR